MQRLLPKAPIEVASLGAAPLGQPQFLPAASRVYLAIDAASRVWYIGLAESIRERLSVHEHLADFRDKKVTAIAWQAESDAEHRRELEKTAIEYFHPPLNVQHNFNELPHTELGLSPEEEIERFFRLKIQAKLIELELAALSPNVVSQCETAGGKISHQLGTVSYQTYPSWRYSEETESLKQELLQRQKQERENSRAVVRSEKTSPVTKLNGAALAGEIAILLSAVLETDNVTEGFEEIEPAE